MAALVYRGEWNANTNSPHLVNGTGTVGDVYNIYVSGSQNLGSGTVSYLQNQSVVYFGGRWIQIPLVYDQGLFSGGSPGSGNVTEVDTSAPLTGGPITNTGTIGFDYGYAGSFTALQTFIAQGIAITSTNRIVLSNSTPSTVLVPVQYSPSLEFKGTYWDGAVSKVAGFRIEQVPLDASGVFGSMRWDYNSDGVYSTDIMTLNSAGSLFYTGAVLGTASTTGSIAIKGKTSGTVTLSVADIAGTWTMKLPTSAGTNLYVLQTDGSGNTSWVAQGGGTSYTFSTGLTDTSGTITNDLSTGKGTGQAAYGSAGITGSLELTASSGNLPASGLTRAIGFNGGNNGGTDFGYWGRNGYFINNSGYYYTPSNAITMDSGGNNLNLFNYGFILLINGNGNFNFVAQAGGRTRVLGDVGYPLTLQETGGNTLVGTTTDNTVDILQVNGGTLTKYIKNTATQTSVGGSTSGTAVFSQPEQGTSYKVVIVKLAALVGTASFTFPTAFGTAPSVIATDDAAAGIVTSKSTTAITVTGATTTGSIILVGY